MYGKNTGVLRCFRIINNVIVIFKYMQIAPLLPDHWPDVSRIYEEGIASGNATFQTKAPEWEQWDNAHVPNVRLVAVENEKIMGWAAISPVSSRPVYAGVAEVSVYVDPLAHGKGIGKLLLKQLIEQSEVNGFWTLQAGIFPENIASLKIHQDLGFRILGTRERIGKMGSIWRNTVLLERRSAVTGIN